MIGFPRLRADAEHHPASSPNDPHDRVSCENDRPRPLGLGDLHQQQPSRTPGYDPHLNDDSAPLGQPLGDDVDRWNGDRESVGEDGSDDHWAMPNGDQGDVSADSSSGFSLYGLLTKGGVLEY